MSVDILVDVGFARAARTVTPWTAVAFLSTTARRLLGLRVWHEWRAFSGPWSMSMVQPLWSA